MLHCAFVERLLSATILSVVFIWVSAAAADERIPPDVVVLNSGGELEGQVSERKEGNLTLIVVQRDDGSVIELPKDQVKFVRRPKEAYAEYLTKKASMPDTVEAHWEMSQWCRDHLDSRSANGANDVGPERRFHLQAVLRLDSEHKQARAFLGFVKEQGNWVNIEQKRLGHGFIRVNRRWMTKDEQRIEESTETWKAQQADWARRLKKIRSSDGRDPALLAELAQIQDPAAIDPLVDDLKDEKNVDWQLLYVDALGNIPSPVASRVLCDMAVTHPNSSVRERAISRLKAESVDRRAAGNYLAQNYLKSDKNELINRAGFVIGEIGEFNTVLPLIDALVTEHIVANPLATDPGAMRLEFGDGGQGFQAGGGQPKQLKITKPNQSVADALRRITRAENGFDEAAWRQWYAEQHTLIDVQVHRDE